MTRRKPNPTSPTVWDLCFQDTARSREGSITPHPGNCHFVNRPTMKAGIIMIRRFGNEDKQERPTTGNTADQEDPSPEIP